MSCRKPLLLLGLVLTACVSTPHYWVVYHNANHIPMQGLPAIPRVVANDHPIELVNFAEETRQLGTIFERYATSAALSELTSRRMPKASEGAYPQLVVRVVSVTLVPMDLDVSFRLAVEAQGFPDPDHAWKPSTHVVPFPSRPVTDWLASDARLLQNDLQTALDALGTHIVSVYLPYDKRARSP